MKNTAFVLTGLLSVMSGVTTSVYAAEEGRAGYECMPANPATAGYFRIENYVQNTSLTTDLVVTCPVTKNSSFQNFEGSVDVFNNTGRTLTCTRTLYAGSYGRVRVDTLTTTVAARLTFPKATQNGVLVVGYKCTLPYQGSANWLSAGIQSYVSNDY